MKRLLIAASLLALAAGQAQAQDAETIIQINGDVEPGCVMGSPSIAQIALNDMTGPDGKLTPALTGSSTGTPAGTVSLPDSWCNTPNKLTVQGYALTLVVVPGYSTPAGFSRHVTYSAEAAGWSSTVIHRPGVDANPGQAVATEAIANDLVLKIYDLETLNSDGTAENPGLLLEAGSYAGHVELTLEVN